MSPAVHDRQWAAAAQAEVLPARRAGSLSSGHSLVICGWAGKKSHLRMGRVKGCGSPACHAKRSRVGQGPGWAKVQGGQVQGGATGLTAREPASRSGAAGDEGGAAGTSSQPAGDVRGPREPRRRGRWLMRWAVVAAALAMLGVIAFGGLLAVTPAAGNARNWRGNRTRRIMPPIRARRSPRISPLPSSPPRITDFTPSRGSTRSRSAG